MEEETKGEKRSGLFIKYDQSTKGKLHLIESHSVSLRKNKRKDAINEKRAIKNIKLVQKEIKPVALNAPSEKLNLTEFINHCEQQNLLNYPNTTEE